MADFGATKWHRITCKTSYNYKYKLIYIYSIYIYTVYIYNDINIIHAMNMTTVVQSSRNCSQLCGSIPNPNRCHSWEKTHGVPVAWPPALSFALPCTRCDGWSSR
jgi:hypothetical protein